MFAGFSTQAVLTGLLVSIVGFGSSFAVVLQGLSSVGASPAQAASGLMALSVAMGLCGIIVSIRTQMPVSVAWSTPGAALLATVPALDGGFSAAVGAFLVCGVMLILAGLWRPIGRIVGAIPTSIANAMLAGVLFNFCISPVLAVGEFPIITLVIVGVWAIMLKINRLYAMPVATVAAALLIAANFDHADLANARLIATPLVVQPIFTLEAIIGVALPLFIVTMASQNVPGVAVLRARDYNPDASPLFRDTGLFSLLSAPFGGHAVNLAAITASMCVGPDAHPDPARRYWAAAASGVFYVVFGVFSGAVVAMAGLAPPVILMTIAGLALMGAFGGALSGSLAQPDGREAALVTFFTAASGIAFLGVGSAFWGLVAGGLLHLFLKSFKTA